MKRKFRTFSTDLLERVMRKAFFAALIAAAFVMGGGVAGTAFIRYVAAPITTAPETASAQNALTHAIAFAPAAKAQGTACTAENPLCDAAFAAFMLKAVLGTNGAGGEPLAALREDAARKLEAAKP